MMTRTTNLTVISRVVFCNDTLVNLSSISNNLRDVYEDQLPKVVDTVSIPNVNCSKDSEISLEQIIQLIRPIPIDQQISIAAIYFDYLTGNDYRWTGLVVDRTTSFRLSSISVNDTWQSNACSSFNAAQEQICSVNLTDSVCRVSSNPWQFTCSRISSRTLETIITPSGLPPWQLGLICSSSILVLFLILFLFGCFYRRFKHSKRLTISQLNLVEDCISEQDSGTPAVRVLRHSNTLNEKTASHTHQVTATEHDDSHHSDLSQVSTTEASTSHLSIADENLSDEDAWLPILDLVYAELARLDEQERRADTDTSRY